MKAKLLTLLLCLCTLTVCGQVQISKPTKQTMPPQKNKSKSISKPKPASPKISEPTGYENGHGYVDLGLSVKWATCNVGANNPSDYGGYYAWGETRTKSNYDSSTYKWLKGSIVTKYCTNPSFGNFDNKTVLDKEDDAVYMNWGGNWHMPTKEQFEELQKGCVWTVVTINGQKGCLVKSKKNSRTIFLPAAGSRTHVGISVGANGYYWSSSLDIESPSSAILFQFYGGTNFWSYYSREVGHSVRAVCL